MIDNLQHTEKHKEKNKTHFNNLTLFVSIYIYKICVDSVHIVVISFCLAFPLRTWHFPNVVLKVLKTF